MTTSSTNSHDFWAKDKWLLAEVRMQQWEYCEVFYFVNRVGSTSTLRLQLNGEQQNDVSSVIEFLNRLGQQGWELVSHVVNQEIISRDDYGKYMYTSTFNTLIFKRPLAS